MRKTPLKTIGKKRKARAAKGETETKIFKQIWDEREHKCEVCKKYIYEPASYCFAHVLSKGMYPKHRLDPRNVKLVCSINCHQEMDKQFIGEKRREFEIFLNS